MDFAASAQLLVSPREAPPADANGTAPSAALQGDEICKVSLGGVLDPRSLREMYKQYMIEAFNGGQTVQTEQRLARAPILAQILGIDSSSVRSVHDELGSYIIRNYLSKVLQERSLNDEDRNFLASIQEALGMPQDLCDRLVLDMKKMHVSTMVERMFDSSQVSPAAVAGIRETAERFGLDMAGDLQLPQPRLLRMLRCEMEDAISLGDVPADDTARLQELQDAYGLPEDMVRAELESCIERRCAGHLLQAATALRRNQPKSVIEETEQLLRFNALMPYTVKNSAVTFNELQVRAGDARGCCCCPSPSSRQRGKMPYHPLGAPRAQDIVDRYQAHCMKSGVTVDDLKSRMDLLQSALGLQEAEAPSG